ncbi:aldo/keto reductase [Kytococcus schroeteri]|uniref:aldo/keto reductase n=1 Tax=Kytococcus schroeteri TaxID=138300 RepID=UPI0035E55773
MVNPTDVPTLTLNNGVEIPQVGFGTFKVDPKGAQRAVEAALEAGYRHIDTAAVYGNEEGVGAAIAASGIARDELFVTTKLRNGEQRKDLVHPAFEESLRKLGLGHVDLYLVHWPAPGLGTYREAWTELEGIYREGGARAIGVSNFLPEHLHSVLEVAEVVPAVNQVELHPSFQQPETQQASLEKGLAVEAYAPIGQGADLELPAVTRIAEAKGVTPAQVVLRWHLQSGRVVIPKSVTPERIASNIDLFGFELSEEEMTDLTAQDTPERMFPDPATADFTMLD